MPLTANLHDVLQRRYLIAVELLHLSLYVALGEAHVPQPVDGLCHAARALYSLRVVMAHLGALPCLLDDIRPVGEEPSYAAHPHCRPIAATVVRLVVVAEYPVVEP